MIPALLCLALPFAGDCTAYVRNVPAIADVLRHRAVYDGRSISVRGRVQRLDQWRSRSGLPAEAFSVCDDGCLRVYLQADSPIRNGQLVVVRGPYYRAYHVGRRVYRDEIEASEVLPER